jgi:tetratricopeptide (TPR) repeat protein
MKSYHRIGGDIATREGRFYAVLRVDGSPFCTSEGTFTENQIDDLMREAARASLRVIRPAILAGLMYRERDYDTTLSVVTTIISGGKHCDLYFWRQVGRFTCRDVVIAPNQKGLAFWQKGNCEDALYEYRKAIALDPDFTWAYVDFGLVLEDMGLWPQALEQYRKAVQRAPDFVEARISLGQALSHQGQWPEALVEYRAAKGLDPAYSVPHQPIPSDGASSSIAPSKCRSANRPPP